LYLTTSELAFRPNDKAKAIYNIPLSIIKHVEPYNYTFLLLPGVSGMKVVTSQGILVFLFLSFSGRSNFEKKKKNLMFFISQLADHFGVDVLRKWCRVTM
jgi:hypothetical protein